MYLWKTGQKVEPAGVIAKLLTVFCLAMLELWAGISAGLALQLPPMVTGATAAAGALLGVLAVILLGEHVRAWLLQQHKGKGPGGNEKRIYRIWERYGVIGLGLLAPLLIGAPLGTALGLALGASPRRLLLWMSLGILAWSALLTFAGATGVKAMGY